VSFPLMPSRFEFKYVLLLVDAHSGGTLESGPVRALEMHSQNYIQTDEFGVHPTPTPQVPHNLPAPASAAATVAENVVVTVTAGKATLVEAPRVAKKPPTRRAAKQPKPTDAELQHLREQLRLQQEKLRKLREEDTRKNAPVSTKPEILHEAAVLLELKHAVDAQFIASQKRKTIKLRWELTDSTTHASRRLQFPFADRVAVSGEEVREAVEQVTTRQFPDIGRVVRILLVVENNKKRVIEKTDKIRLPLQFPGPVFKDTQVFVLECEFEHPQQVQIGSERVYFKLHAQKN